MASNSSSTIRRILGASWRGFDIFCTLTERFWVIFGVILLIGMWGLLLVYTIARWMDTSNVGWTIEIVGYMIAWSVFIMGGPVTRHDQHINVSLLPEKLLGEKRAKTFIEIMEDIVGLVICTYLTLHSYRFFNTTRQIGWTVESVGGWDYPLWIIRTGIFWGFLFCSFFYFERIVKLIRNFFIGKTTGDKNYPDAPTGDVYDGHTVAQEKETKGGELESETAA